MCLIALAVEVHSRFPLVLVANRDERYARATAPAAEWSGLPGVFAGRDLVGGGTWLAVSRSGRWAAVTNYHEGVPPRPDAPTRGELVTGYVSGSASPQEYLAGLAPRAAAYNGFNLLVGERAEAWWFANRGGAPPRRLEPGVHGLSNHLLNTPWPKVERARASLADLLRGEAPVQPSALLDLLHDREVPSPATHPALSPLERAFAAAFIVTPEYGTRATSALLLHADGGGLLAERTFTRGGPEYREVRHEL